MRIYVVLLFLFLVSCATKPFRSYEGRVESVKDSQNLENMSYVTLSELMVDAGSGSNNEVVKIEKEQILNRCESRYLEMLEYYSNGELRSAKLLFDIIIENLEYLYPEERLSDSLMILDLSRNSYNPHLRDSDEMFKIYNSLYRSFPTKQLVIETRDAEKSDETGELNRYIEDKIKRIYKDRRLRNKQFISSVAVHYTELKYDLFNLKEVFLRYSKYESFLKDILKLESLPEYYSFIPSVLSAYYNNKNSGGIWKLERSGFLGMRSDIGASTAEFVKRVKRNSRKNHLDIVSTILKDRGTAFRNGVSSLDIDDPSFSEFVAFSIILSNPNDIGFEATNLGNKNIEWKKSYNIYKKNPEKFKKQKRKKRKKSRKSVKKRSSYISLKYKVRRGDTLGKIAKLYKTDVKSIKRWNPRSTSKSYLNVGTTLYLRGYNFKKYKARYGDYIGRICKKFGMTQSQFKKINNLKSNKIFKNKRYYVYSR